jgi:hypothetical protein
MHQHESVKMNYTWEFLVVSTMTYLIALAWNDSARSILDQWLLIGRSGWTIPFIWILYAIFVTFFGAWFLFRSNTMDDKIQGVKNKILND